MYGATLVLRDLIADWNRRHAQGMCVHGPCEPTNGCDCFAVNLMVRVCFKRWLINNVRPFRAAVFCPVCTEPVRFT
jgi:hypothetical protein